MPRPFWEHLIRMVQNAALVLVFIVLEFGIIWVVTRLLGSNPDPLIEEFVLWLKRVSVVAASIYYLIYAGRELWQWLRYNRSE